MPIVSVSWTDIKAKFAGNTKILALTDRQISLLSSLSEQLTWGKTFRTDDANPEDAEEISDEVQDLIRWLTMPVDLGDIFQYVDDVETLLREIRDLTQANQPCCNDTSPLPNPYESPNAPNYPNNPPATYGESEPIANSADWESLVCNAAHNYVDLLKTTSDELNKLITTGALIIGGIAGLLALATSAGILSAIAYSAASSATSALLALLVKTVIADSVQDLEDARASIVCAIVHGNGEELATAVQDAVDGEAWLAWFKWVDYETAWNVMIDGGRDGEYLDVDRRTDCDCPADLGPFTFTKTTFPYAHYSTQAPPGCHYANTAYNPQEMYEHPTFASGDIRIQGTIRVVGTMTPHTNCQTNKNFTLTMKSCGQNTPDGWPSCTSATPHQIAYIPEMDLNFDETWNFDITQYHNTKYVTVGANVYCRIGTADFDIELNVTSIEEL